MPVTFHDRDAVSLIDEATSGGSPFSHEHPAPYGLVGLDVRSGNRIDAVTPIYRELKDDGTVGEEVAGPRFGGTGGGVTRVQKPGYVIAGLSF